MRIFLKTAGILFLLAIGVYLPVNGQQVFVNVNEIQGLDLDGRIISGSTITIPVRFTNAGEARTAISNGFRFIPDGVTWDTIVARWNQAYPWNWESAFPSGCYPPACYPFFDQGTYINYFANGVGLAGLTGAQGTGLPADFDDVAYLITVENVTGSYGTLTMDSSWWEPANFWLWSGVSENVEWGGPYELQLGYPPPPPTVWCTPQPTILHESDPLIEFHVDCWRAGVGFQCEDVIIESIRVFPDIPPYEGYPIIDQYGNLTTACKLTRFLGANRFRPIPPEGIQSVFGLRFDTYSGWQEVFWGDYVLAVYQGDVNLDGDLNLQDAVFLAEYLFQDGSGSRLWDEDMNELMDIDASGRVDLNDISDLIDMVGI